MSEVFNLSTVPKTIPSVIVFGLMSGKPHASTFAEQEVERAERAAALMQLRVLRVTEADHLAVAQALPAGRVFVSGKAFVPFVKKPLYERLCGFAGSEAPDGDRPTIEVQPTRADRAIEDSTNEGHDLPKGWKAIGPNSLVLATDGPCEGWWEAVVEVVDQDEFTLRWRDFPLEEYPWFNRRRDELALLPSPTVYGSNVTP